MLVYNHSLKNIKMMVLLQTMTTQS